RLADLPVYARIRGSGTGEQEVRVAFGKSETCRASEWQSHSGNSLVFSFVPRVEDLPRIGVASQSSHTALASSTTLLTRPTYKAPPALPRSGQHPLCFFKHLDRSARR